MPCSGEERRRLSSTSRQVAYRRDVLRYDSDGSRPFSKQLPQTLCRKEGRRGEERRGREGGKRGEGGREEREEPCVGNKQLACCLL